jgi:Fe-S oxidoreductase
MSSGKIGGKEKLFFAPGCALMLYKPELADKLHQLLNKNFGNMDMLMTCCQHELNMSAGSKIINVCPGCDKRFSNDYTNISTISLWEILADTAFFNFPDFEGRSMTINDACPVRDKEKVHYAIRELLVKMNINLVEPENTRANSICCGDGSYGELPTNTVKELMVKRAAELPLADVVVYCVSCIKSIYNGGKKPHYLLDLLFDTETVPKTCDPDEWHKELAAYKEKH